MQEKFQVSNPLVQTPGQVFEKETSVSLELGLPGVAFYYTLDGSTPDESSARYTAPITIQETCTLKALAVANGWLPSDVEVRDFVKAKYRAVDVKLETPIDERYPGQGAKSLIDRASNSTNFHSGHWLGFEATDLTAIVDLGSEVEIKHIIVSCLSATGAWIFRPGQISAEISSDGSNFGVAGEIKLPAQTEADPTKIEFPRLDIATTIGRYVKVTVHNIDVVPDWHHGAGGKSWLFVDEILVS